MVGNRIVSERRDNNRSLFNPRDVDGFVALETAYRLLAKAGEYKLCAVFASISDCSTL